MQLKTEYFLKQNRDEPTLLSLSKWGVWLNSEYGLKVNNYGNNNKIENYDNIIQVGNS